MESLFSDLGKVLGRPQPSKKCKRKKVKKLKQLDKIRGKVKKMVIKEKGILDCKGEEVRNISFFLCAFIRSLK